MTVSLSVCLWPASLQPFFRLKHQTLAQTEGEREGREAIASVKVPSEVSSRARVCARRCLSFHCIYLIACLSSSLVPSFFRRFRRRISSPLLSSRVARSRASISLIRSLLAAPAPLSSPLLFLSLAAFSCLSHIASLLHQQQLLLLQPSSNARTEARSKARHGKQEERD